MVGLQEKDMPIVVLKRESDGTLINHGVTIVKNENDAIKKLVKKMRKDAFLCMHAHQLVIGYYLLRKVFDDLGIIEVFDSVSNRIATEVAEKKNFEDDFEFDRGENNEDKSSH